MIIPRKNNFTIKTRILIVFVMFFTFHCFGQQAIKDEITVFDTVIGSKPKGKKILSPEYVSFLAKLTTAVNNQDSSLLLTMIDENVEISAGGGVYGKIHFWEFFSAISAKEGWKLISVILKMGGYKEIDEQGEYLIFPFQRSTLFYLKTKDVDTIDCSPYCIYYSIEDTITLYENPTITSKKVATLNYPILIRQLEDIDEPRDYYFVKTINNKVAGWVLSQNVHCDASGLVQIRRVKNELKITSITPFD